MCSILRFIRDSIRTDNIVFQRLGEHPRKGIFLRLHITSLGEHSSAEWRRSIGRSGDKIRG